MVKVVAGVIERDGRILIARRRKEDKFGGKWEFPGGKVKPGETPQESLTRELEEELGIKTRICEFICSSRFTYPHISVEILAYKVTYISGSLHLTDHDRIEWVRPDEIGDYDFLDADRPIIDRVVQSINCN